MEVQVNQEYLRQIEAVVAHSRRFHSSAEYISFLLAAVLDEVEASRSPATDR